MVSLIIKPLSGNADYSVKAYVSCRYSDLPTAQSLNACNSIAMAWYRFSFRSSVLVTILQILVIKKSLFVVFYSIVVYKKTLQQMIKEYP
ncbi:hypothetical protein YZOS03_13130 [Vibrio alginolyticus]|nr:hypothetical protein YZOS03_13130 [Vibrio alginolyticus]